MNEPRCEEATTNCVLGDGTLVRCARCACCTLLPAYLWYLPAAHCLSLPLGLGTLFKGKP